VRSRFWPVLGLIVVAAAGIRVVYVLTVTRHDTHFYDAAYYELEASSIAHGDGFTDPFAKIRDPDATPGPSAEHAPLTSLVLVPAALVDDPGTRSLLMRFTMVALGLGTVVVLALLGRALGGDVVGLVAAGIAALDPNLWMNDGLVMSETLCVLVVAAILLVTYRVLRGASWRWILALGALCGLLALVRAELAVFTVVLAVPAVWIGAAQRGQVPGQRIGRAAACVALAAVVVAPWIGYNLTRFDKPTFVSTNDGLTMIAANCDATYYGSRIGAGDITCADAHRPHGDPSVVNAALRSRAFRYVRDHAERYPLVVAARIGRMWSVFHVGQTVDGDTGEGRPRWASYLGVGVLYVVVALAVVGGVATRRRKVPIWPLVVPIVVVTAVTLVIAGVPRYRAAAEPSLVVLAALGIAALLRPRRPSDDPSPDDGAAPEAGTTSQNTNPSRATTSPTVTGIGDENPGPSQTKVWNSPRSPHGSTWSGRSARRSTSKARPAKEAGTASGSTQVITARTPASSISRARRSVGSPQSGNIGATPDPARCASRYWRTSARNRSPNTTRSTASARATRTASCIASS
jgi:4-amino-4-deoxy-L-arabinose transferase-like glycosyltransferase